tara:strand:+ start:5983 stop:6897 length:915 start_codon:yes stop_codon:yes gene_type:complete
MKKKNNLLQRKIEISSILEEIEINFERKEVIEKLDKFFNSPKAHVVGITGPPGVGKSSMINKLLRILRNKNLSVGVLAVDPSSKESGGALLGDRARFEINPNDHNIFVRSLATKNFLGGISEMTFPCMNVLRSFFDIIIIETVGVGQSEISIQDIVDTVIFCVQPGSGDSLQFIKSGIIEIPDIICVTKSDLSKLANNTLSDIKSVKKFFTRTDQEISILSVSSNDSVGFENLYKSIDERWLYMKSKNKLYEQRRVQAEKWLKNTLINRFGLEGFKKISEIIEYGNNPFSSLRTISERIKIDLL